MPLDEEACLAIFDSNVPFFLGAQEKIYFVKYLRNIPGLFIVIEDDGEIVACGGAAQHASEFQAMKLDWGLVLNSRHKTGLGHILLRERFARASMLPEVSKMVVNTSQHCEGFFIRMGFVTRRVILDGYFDGMHKHEMVCDLSHPQISAVKPQPLGR
ncbi:MAG: GNAT family N-acetyltransferase [Caulobacteraceae bacterium]